MIPVLAISLQPLAFFTILARPVTQQNLSDWRRGGCQERLANQDLLFQSAIRNPQSAIRNPQSAIRNPQSAIRNPQSAIRNPQSAIRNPQSKEALATGQPPIVPKLCLIKPDRA
jgi:hypothetical protein